MVRRRRPQTYHPSVRALIWHQTAERFGRAYGEAARAEYERLRAIAVPWCELKWSKAAHGRATARLVYKFGKPYVPKIPIPALKRAA
jgi:hypothetical protein